MGLISRVSSRTYRSYHKNHQTWVLDVIHGTSAERLVAESHRCTRSESSNSDDQLPTPRSSQSACIPSGAWAVTKSFAPSVSITETSAGPVKVLPEPRESSMSSTTPPVTN